MTPDELIKPVILEELGKYEQQGRKIKLKTVKKKRITYSIIFGIIALLTFTTVCFVIAAIVYGVMMKKTTDTVEQIIAFAKKNPDKPIDQIIAEELM